jgi:DNA polymerase III gamma/tau subunit
MLLSKNGNTGLVDTTLEIRETIARQAQMIQTSHLLESIERFNIAASDTRRSGWQPGLGFELALAETIQVMSEKPVAAKSVAKTADEPPASKKMDNIPTSSTQEKVSPVSNHIQEAPKESKAVKEIKEESPVQTPAAGSEFTTIANNWRKIGETVRKFNPATQALLNSCKPSSIKNGVLYLTFVIDLLKTKMEGNDHLENTRRAVQVVTGLDYPVRCIVSGIKAAGDQDKLKIDSDGMVSTALRELGGQVVDVQEIDENDE